MIYTYGDGGVLIHPRYEGYGRELETMSRLALPPAESTSAPDTSEMEDVREVSRVGASAHIAPPVDYAPDD